MGLAARAHDDIVWDIPISDLSGTPVSGEPDIEMAITDTLEFTNNASYPVSIVFTTTSGSVFNNISSLAGGGTTSPAQSPKLDNMTVNYTITNLNTNAQSTPCGIQVGVGPLRIDILAANTIPDPVSIPAGGQIQFFPDEEYDISIVPPNAFNKSLNTISPPSSVVLTATDLSPQATYTIKGSGIKGTDGKGTVKIGS
jgi:hypothetical protein